MRKVHARYISFDDAKLRGLSLRIPQSGTPKQKTEKWETEDSRIHSISPPPSMYRSAGLGTAFSLRTIDKAIFHQKQSIVWAWPVAK